jgi:predicted neuraminidase
MKKNLCLFLLSTLILNSCKNGTDKTHNLEESEYSQMGESTELNEVTGNFKLPPISYPGEGAFVSGELIYPLDDKPTPQCHSSSIVETASGLVATFFAGTHERNPDVGIRISRLVDGSWTRPIEVANGIENDTLRYPTWNPVLFQPDNGPLILFYKIGPDPRTWWGMLMTSDDDGRSWSKPSKLGTNDKIGHLLGPIKNKPIQLTDGTIICPSSTEYESADGDDKWMVHFEITKDLGKTWEVIGPINNGLKFDAIQPSILTYPDGKMQVLCRTRQDVVAESWSDDKGMTWTEMKATSLPNPNSGIDAITLKDGRQLLIYNHTTKKGKEPNNRNMLNLAISRDGHNWTPVMTLETKPVKAGYSYPAIIQTSDGLVHITYTYLRQSIKHVVINPDKLTF